MKNISKILRPNCTCPQGGFTLIEFVLVIVIMGIMSAVAVQKIAPIADSFKVEETKAEMDKLVVAIVGNPELQNNGVRSDFGYVGDVGALPPNLDALLTNPGSYSTWDGPYIQNSFEQMIDDFKKDAWQTNYTYAGGSAITSTGSGSTVERRLAGSSDFLLYNQITGNVYDLDGTPPDDTYNDSVAIRLTIPDGAGSTITKSTITDVGGYFSFDSIPIGNHTLRVIYVPDNDTIKRFVSVSAGSNPYSEYYLSSDIWTGGGGGGGGSGTETLRPDGAGSITNLTNSGCSNNYECVDEVSADDDATYVERKSNSYATDIYSITNSSVGAGTIDSVEVYCRTKKAQTNGNVRPTLYIGGSEYNGTAQGLTTSYVDYLQSWTINPNTSLAWTWSNINSLEVGVSIKGQNSGKPAYCTQVWIIVYYTN
ncbi:MAG: prepilin-type N-terminal cleavage/methylation domain-containing protein [candidate division Zixibacteria bacterium]|nr:prepilin-type N-terminal cleavage/methylation domain-containing protein [candidate division Zixibacteria bacterium]